jgi:predicted amidohydrolase
MTKIAIMQLEPIHTSLESTLQKALDHIDMACKEGAEIVVFGESWFCGYPAWIDFCDGVAKWDHEPVKAAWANMYENALELEGAPLARLCTVAKENKIAIITGANEVVKTGKGHSSIYNTIFTIDDKGNLANHHRKLMPTYNEKLIHHSGDGAGLYAIDTKNGRIGSLICWEHWMPLTRQAMHDEAEDIHFALWPHVVDRHLLASRHYAFEGRCYVIAVGQIMHAKSIPSDLHRPANFSDNATMIMQGGSCAIGPNGEMLTQQVIGKEEIVYVELPHKKELIKERMNLAVSGHYQRDDVFTFEVDRRRKK